MLNDKTVRQTVPVIAYDGENAVYYTFSTKIKKGAVGSCFVKIFNMSIDEDGNELLEQIVDEELNPISIEVLAGEEVNYKEYSISKILPKTNNLVIEFYGSADTLGNSDAIFTDNMLAEGEYKSQWTQANGEIMNTNVVIDIDGITVKTITTEESTADEYTVISTKEFAGYYDGKQVFTLNKGVTKVNSLEATSETKMPPIKIVPVTEGELIGWAFVPST